MEHILADRWATEALRQLLIADNRATLETITNWLSQKFKSEKRTKRGPKPKRGVHTEQEVLRLKRAGKTNGQIAKMLGTKNTIVAAAYNNITNKIARQQRQDRLAALNAAQPPANN